MALTHHSDLDPKQKKAVTTALGRNPAEKTKGESMHNGFQSSLPTATV